MSLKNCLTYQGKQNENIASFRKLLFLTKEVHQVSSIHLWLQLKNFFSWPRIFKVCQKYSTAGNIFHLLFRDETTVFYLLLTSL